ncbi:ABC transporter substrate-binding protein [Caenimonas aquaedulcis]|uniref:Thiamine pyrimidine synthase n=1 Tax=Caenimonas aquaedulcis TaxID=2793270 RepID=A0A931MEC5_9BURK|nr:ABC transporter substrate-binding protein [Caenimonas aquaedulcis]MBG9386598.1 ABC transporter substrate-binding protein [Caenimonas aquaedulcis]
MRKPPPLGRRAFIADSLLASAGATTALVSVGARAQGGLHPMSLQLGWALGSTQMGEIVARRKGFYAQEGLVLTLQPGGPNFDGVAVVGSGRAELGQTSSSPSLMLAVSQGVPIRCFAVGAQRHPYTFFSLPGHAVRKPADLRGKRISMNPTGMVLLRALLAQHGMSERDVRVVPSGAGMGLLLTGQADVATGWATNTAAIRELGAGVVQMSLWDAGIRLYALPYYAATRTLETHPREIEGFLRATARGWRYAAEHRDEAVDIAVKDYPQLGRADERVALDRMLEYSLGGRAATEGWGAMDPVFWQQQIDLCASLGQFSAGKPALADVMTPGPLNATKGARLRAA